MVAQNPLHFLFSFPQFLLCRMSSPLSTKDRKHLQGNRHHGAKRHRVERSRVVVRSIVGHPHHATRSHFRMQAKGDGWL